MTKTHHPDWAKAMVKMYFAKCWISTLDFEHEIPDMMGINKFHDTLLSVCVFIHQTFVQPFCETEAFPLQILEIYSDTESGETT